MRIITKLLFFPKTICLSMLEMKYKNDDENEVHTSITSQRRLFVFRRDDKGPSLNYMEAKAYNPLQGIECHYN